MYEGQQVFLNKQGHRQLVERGINRVPPVGTLGSVLATRIPQVLVKFKGRSWPLKLDQSGVDIRSPESMV